MGIKTPLYIFDLDGTLADIRHRLHYIKRDRKDQDWYSFFNACYCDKLIDPVVKTLDAIMAAGCEVWIFSGRSDAVEEDTRLWLFDAGINYDWLQMRRDGDYTPDDQLKESWLDSMLEDDLNRLVAVFDDRKRVVDMWRRRGIQCFQVNDGDF